MPREAASECVNRTLDYAYGDFCISQIAGLLGETEVQKRYAERAQNYRRLFDPATGFMRGRDAGGQMTETFDPIGWGGDYTEGGPGRILSRFTTTWRGWRSCTAAGMQQHCP